STVNSIIGHGGVHARRFEASTGVALVVGERIQGCQERVVELYGPSERIIIAVCDLAENVLKVHPLVRRHIGVLYTTTQETPEDSCSEVTVRLSFKLGIFPDLNAAQVGWECGAQVVQLLSDIFAFVISFRFIVSQRERAVIRVAELLSWMVVQGCRFDPAEVVVAAAGLSTMERFRPL
ncbi:hypothetical protein FOZ63_026177, partial [Perkinsus olseni]